MGLSNWLKNAASGRGKQPEPARRNVIRWRMAPPGAASSEDKTSSNRTWFESSRDLNSGVAVTDFGEHYAAPSQWADTQSLWEEWNEVDILVGQSDNAQAKRLQAGKPR